MGSIFQPTPLKSILILKAFQSNYPKILFYNFSVFQMREFDMNI